MVKYCQKDFIRNLEVLNLISCTIYLWFQLKNGPSCPFLTKSKETFKICDNGRFAAEAHSEPCKYLRWSFLEAGF